MLRNYEKLSKMEGLNHNHHHFICSLDVHTTIHKQNREGCRAVTAAPTQTINQIHQYSKVHVITIKTQ